RSSSPPTTRAIIRAEPRCQTRAPKCHVRVTRLTGGVEDDLADPNVGSGGKRTSDRGAGRHLSPKLERKSRLCRLRGRLRATSVPQAAEPRESPLRVDLPLVLSDVEPLPLARSARAGWALGRNAAAQ